MDNRENETISGNALSVKNAFLAADSVRADPVVCSNAELAMKLRRIPYDLHSEALARLLESASKDHDMLAAGEMKWRGLCEKAYEVMRTYVGFVDGLRVGMADCDTPAQFNSLCAAKLELEAALGIRP